MKKTMLMMLFPVALLLVMLKLNALPNQDTDKITQKIDTAGIVPETIDEAQVISLPEKAVDSDRSSKRDQIISYAFSLLGTPYLFGGKSKNGFDCSGFTTYVFEQNGIPLKRSSTLQATEGEMIDRDEAAPGDLVIFTGTDESVREPGHVGIVISEPGDTIEFIHSSSSRRDGGVKVSQVEGSGYDARFLEVRRVLN